MARGNRGTTCRTLLLRPLQQARTRTKLRRRARQKEVEKIARVTSGGSANRHDRRLLLQGHKRDVENPSGSARASPRNRETDALAL